MSSRLRRSHTTSSAARDPATNSLSVVEHATRGAFLLFQETAPPFKVDTHAKMLRRVSVHEAQSESDQMSRRLASGRLITCVGDAQLARAFDVSQDTVACLQVRFPWVAAVPV